MVHTDEWEHMAWLRLRGLLPEEDGAGVFDGGIEVGQEDRSWGDILSRSA